MKTDRPIAVIVGSGGQDGQLLAENLQGIGYEVVGLRRDTINIANSTEVAKFISGLHPREVYFLAAHHHSSEEASGGEGALFHESFNVNASAVANFLNAIAVHSPSSRFFYASSCLIFPPAENGKQAEATVPRPESAYAISKAAGMLVCQYYRNAKGVFASSGILYNHESPLRGARFLSKKIVSAAVRIARDGYGSLVLGNLASKVDWGYAPDYVDAMRRILQLSSPADYVVATGEAHTVREFAEIAFSSVGLDYQEYVSTKPELLARQNHLRIGDAARLRADTGWSPSISFEEMVQRLVEEEKRIVDE
ncbi:MAG: GDP-mannose 4,6-dehydratase [Nitrosomonadaceae bacterium]|nr:GDP-mannose 4,6-dehydratase [Nitrosomonadaceae bacterium]